MASAESDPFVIPVHIRCECGNTTHVTVHLTASQLEQAAERAARKVLADELRRGRGSTTYHGPASANA